VQRMKCATGYCASLKVSLHAWKHTVENLITSTNFSVPEHFVFMILASR
jgi:hypothetical protein